MGNLILVAPQINERLRNRPFRDKLKILKENHVPLDDVLAQSVEWTNKQAEKRILAMADLFYNKILKV